MTCTAIAYRTQAKGRRSLFGTVLAPKPGPECSLLVTDVQGSTQLWEALPAEVMDTALQVRAG